MDHELDNRITKLERYAVSLDAKITKLERSTENLSDATLTAVKALVAHQGGIARAAKLSPERRSEIARVAAAARWRLHRKPNRA